MMTCVLAVLFVFFKQKTAYEMRISDWSSDVCSSDLDVRGFLQGLVTNDTSGNLPVWAALLTAQGKALFDFLIRADREDVLIDCERDAAEALVKRLTLYRLRRPITIAIEPGLAVHWAPGGDLGVVDPRLAELGQRRSEEHTSELQSL